MKRYIGTPLAGPGGAHVVVVDDLGGKAKPLDPRHDLRNHSPDGFSWGYAGSGPAQLALALLADVAGDVIAQRRYQDFKFEVIAKLAQNEAWGLTTNEIEDWVREKLMVEEIEDLVRREVPDV